MPCFSLNLVMCFFMGIGVGPSSLAELGVATGRRGSATGFSRPSDQRDPDGGIPAGTAFEDIPADWVCPACGARKDDFRSYEQRLVRAGSESGVTARSRAPSGRLLAAGRCSRRTTGMDKSACRLRSRFELGRLDAAPSTDRGESDITEIAQSLPMAV